MNFISYNNWEEAFLDWDTKALAEVACFFYGVLSLNRELERNKGKIRALLLNQYFQKWNMITGEF